MEDTNIDDVLNLLDKIASEDRYYYRIECNTNGTDTDIYLAKHPYEKFEVGQIFFTINYYLNTVSIEFIKKWYVNSTTDNIIVDISVIDMRFNSGKINELCNSMCFADRAGDSYWVMNIGELIDNLSTKTLTEKKEFLDKLFCYKISSTSTTFLENEYRYKCDPRTS